MAINLVNKYLCKAQVFHKRLKPKVNKFTYNVFYICFDIAKINDLKSRIFAIDKFNIFSIRQKDYGPRDGSNIEKWARNILAKNNIKNIDKIFLLTHPRILGFAFNPVSFWFCIDDNENLLAVIAEVNNTFGETHYYLVHNHDHNAIKNDQWLVAKKEFHVSPFYHIKGQYKFRFIFNIKKIAVWIDYYENNKSLLTSLITKNIALNDYNLLKTLFFMPFMAFKVIILIHWQALKLFIKKIKYVPKPAKPNHNLTTSEKI